jgi:hypothetical protein
MEHKEERREVTAKMYFMRWTAGYTLFIYKMYREMTGLHITKNILIQNY